MCAIDLGSMHWGRVGHMIIHIQHYIDVSIKYCHDLICSCFEFSFTFLPGSDSHFAIMPVIKPDAQRVKLLKVGWLGLSLTNFPTGSLGRPSTQTT